MPRYFKPTPTKGNVNYYVTRIRRNGERVRDQLPCEGVYTPYEMSKIVDTIPGEWVNIPASEVGYVFGLRQHLTVGK